MSWDVINEKEIPCPCGKGVLKHFFEMDDWNRCREYVVIDCAECRKKYTITSETIQHPNPVKDITNYYCTNEKEKIKLDF